jgi:L-amino acid N-acyltransferase YncA
MYIRDAVEADLEAIVYIYNQSIPSRNATADTKPVSVASRAPWYSDRKNYRPLWVAERNHKILGWLSFQSFYGRPAYDHTAEVSIYVATEYQRQGIGSKLLAQAIARSPALDIKTLLGFIFGHNQASLNLFTRYGYTQWGYLPDVAELDGIKRDLIILGRKI